MQKIKLNYASDSTNANLELARTFDIGYLFMETLSDILYVKGYIKNSPNKIDDKDLSRLIPLYQILRNNLFSIADRYLIETYEQRKLEKLFSEVLSNIDFDLIEKNSSIAEKILYIRKAGIDKINKSKLDKYYESIITRLSSELNKLEFSEKFKNNLFSKINKGIELETLLLEIYKELAIINKKINFSTKESMRILNGVVRELQAIENNKIISLGDKITTKLFFEIIDSRDYYEMKIPKNDEKEIFFNLVLDTHKEIDNLIDSYNEEKDKLNLEFKEKLKSLNLKEDGFTFLRLDEELKSILHHLFDWYVKIYPERINKKDAKKIAVIIYILYEKIKGVFSKSEIYLSQEIDTKFLTNFGGWKSQSGIYQIQYTHFSNFLDFFNGDISLMIEKSFKLPKNWEKLWSNAGGIIDN